MSNIIRSVSRNWDYITHFEPPLEEEVTFIGNKAASWRMAIEVISILVVSLIGFAILLKGWAFPFSPLWLLMGGVVSAISLHRVLSRSNQSAHISLEPTKLRLVGGGFECEIIDYEDIVRIKFDQASNDRWLTIVTSDARAVEVPFSGSKEDRTRAEMRVVKYLHPILAERFAFERSPSPEIPLEALEYRHFYQIPEVELVPGVTYRYAYSKGLREKLGKALATPLDLIPLAFLQNTPRPLWLLAGAAGAVYLIFRMRKIVPGFVFYHALDDKFALTSEGVRITRKGKTWVVPFEKTRGYLLDGPLFMNGRARRYGRGFKVYYLDTRFIEADT